MSRTREGLISLAKEMLEVDLTEEMIASGTKFADINVDSLDSIELLVTLEDRLDLELDDARLNAVTNIKELLEYLSEFD